MGSPTKLGQGQQSGMRLESRLGAMAAVLGFVGVLLGAFGAHALEGTVTPERLLTFETGVRYHLMHALALLAVAAFARSSPTRALALAGHLFALGTLVFSGSLYLLVLLDLGWMGAITPLGGVALLIGWMALAAHFLAAAKRAT